EDQTPGHVVIVNGTDFVRTDGSLGLARIVSPEGKTFDQRAEVKLAHRITASPVLLPANGSIKARLCVADASNTLTVLDAEALTVMRHWTLPAKITAGPFVREGKVGCVVGRNRLIWLDLGQDKICWGYPFAADIVGEPNLIDGILV